MEIKSKLIYIFLITTFFLNIGIKNSFSQDKAYRVRRVVIDAGHGGKDPGALGKKSKEKDIALSIALKLGTYIKQYIPEVEVIYTRKTDVFVELYRRSEIANERNADLFISVHVNSHPKSKHYGTSTYIMGLHKAQENLEVARRENSVVLKESDYPSRYQGFDPNSPGADIILSLYQNAYLNQSTNLAANIQEQFTKRAGRRDFGVRQAGLLVLWNCTMPAVLVETGFISNPTEEKFLMGDYGQSLIASAIFRAFRDYKEKLDTQSEELFLAENKNKSDEKKIKTELVNNSEKTDNSGKKKDGTTKNNPEQKEKSDVITYKIQLKSSKTKLDIKKKPFSNLKNIEETLSDGLFKYTSGAASSYKDIAVLLPEVRKSFPDAFVVAFNNGEKISVTEAKKLENSDQPK
jgi:N-acetylmuramoyl-L-alanine amidase